jgi:hypothetical protein
MESGIEAISDDPASKRRSKVREIVITPSCTDTFDRVMT